MNSIFSQKTSYSELFNSIESYQSNRQKLVSLVYQTIQLFDNLSITSNGEIVKYCNLDSLNDLIRNLGSKRIRTDNNEEVSASHPLENPVIVVLGKNNAGKSTFIEVLLKKNKLAQSANKNVRFCFSKDSLLDSDHEETLENDKKDGQTNNLTHYAVSAKFLKSGIDLIDTFDGFNIVDLSNLLRSIHLPLVIYVIDGRSLLKKAEISYLRELKKSCSKLDVIYFISHLDKADDGESNTAVDFVYSVEYKMARCFKQLQFNKLIPASFANWSDCPFFHGASLKYIKSYQDKIIIIRSPKIQYHFDQFSRFRTALFNHFSNVFTSKMIEFCDVLVDSQMEISLKIINFTQNFVVRLKDNVNHLEFIKSMENRMYSQIEDSINKPEFKHQLAHYLKSHSSDILEPIKNDMYPMYLEIPENGIVDDPTIVDECVNAIRNLLILGIENILKDLLEKEIFENYRNSLAERFYDRTCRERITDKIEQSPYQLVLERKLNRNYNLEQIARASNNRCSGALHEFMNVILSSIKTYLKEFSNVVPEENDSSVNSTAWKMKQTELLLKEWDHHSLGEEICKNLYSDFEMKHEAFRKLIETETHFLKHNIGESHQEKMASTENVPQLFTLFLHTLNIKGKCLFRDVIVSDKIGEERGSKIYQCFVKNQEMILKKMDLTIYPLKKIAEEIFYSLQFSHPNLLTTCGVVLNEIENKLQIFRPKLNFDLESFIKKNSLNPETKFNISIQIACGLKYLHDHDIMHRDLKLANILINEDKHIVLAEYGFCKSEALSQSTFIGNAIHIAPEIIKGELYTKEIDIYAFGYLLWHIFEGTGKKPQNVTKERSTNQIIWKSGNFDFNLRPEKMESFPNEVWDLMCRCWSTDPKSRPDIGKIMDELTQLSQLNN